jgi:hypothetical protein
MKVTIYSAVILGGALALGVTVFKDDIQTALFDDGDFVQCFKSSILSDIQSKAAQRKGRIPDLGPIETILGPSAESAGYERARSIKRNGIDEVLKQAKSDRTAEASAQLDIFKKAGTLPENSTKGQIADATVKCLELQTLF